MNNFYPFGFQIFAHLSLDPETIPPSWVTATDRTSKVCPVRTQLNLYGATAIPPRPLQFYFGLTQHSYKMPTIILHTTRNPPRITSTTENFHSHFNR